MWGFFHKPLFTDPYILESKTMMTIYPLNLGIVINNQDHTTQLYGDSSKTIISIPNPNTTTRISHGKYPAVLFVFVGSLLYPPLPPPLPRVSPDGAGASCEPLVATVIE